MDYIKHGSSVYVKESELTNLEKVNSYLVKSSNHLILDTKLGPLHCVNDAFSKMFVNCNEDDFDNHLILSSSDFISAGLDYHDYISINDKIYMSYGLSMKNYIEIVLEKNNDKFDIFTQFTPSGKLTIYNGYIYELTNLNKKNVPDNKSFKDIKFDSLFTVHNDIIYIDLNVLTHVTDTVDEYKKMIDIFYEHGAIIYNINKKDYVNIVELIDYYHPNKIITGKQLHDDIYNVSLYTFIIIIRELYRTNEYDKKLQKLYDATTEYLQTRDISLFKDIDYITDINFSKYIVNSIISNFNYELNNIYTNYKNIIEVTDDINDKELSDKYGDSIFTLTKNKVEVICKEYSEKISNIIRTNIFKNM